MSLKKARLSSLQDKHEAAVEHVREELEAKDEKVEKIIKKSAKKD